MTYIDPPELDQALALLTQRDVIEAVDGGYRFQVELTRRWFAQRGGEKNVKATSCESH